MQKSGRQAHPTVHIHMVGAAQRWDTPHTSGAALDWLERHVAPPGLGYGFLGWARAGLGYGFEGTWRSVIETIFFFSACNYHHETGFYTFVTII